MRSWPPRPDGPFGRAASGMMVELVGKSVERISPNGPASSIHEGELVLDAEAVAALLTRPFMERVASAYRLFLRHVSLGLLRVRVEPDWEAIRLPVPRPLLLVFRAPVYREGPNWAEVSWRIDRGLLVARRGRGRGSLRFRLELLDPAAAREGLRARVLARAEVEGYQPLIRGSGRLAGAGSWLYGHTQARIHRHVMRNFLRSLADLKPTVSDPATPGAMRQGR